jgi:DNA-directed RNA polymerase specialized sigma24 family protein
MVGGDAPSTRGKLTATNAVIDLLKRLRRIELARKGEKQTDAQLLERFVRARDSMALETLVHRYAPMVWGVCRRILPNVHDAEDAFQATFFVFVHKAASIQFRSRFAGWLHNVADKTARKAREYQDFWVFQRVADGWKLHEVKQSSDDALLRTPNCVAAWTSEELAAVERGAILL